MSYALARTPTENDRALAALAHGGTLIAWFVAPLLVYVHARGTSEWLERQARDALVWSAIGTAASMATCGLALPLFAVFHVIAAVKAYAGEPYRYPWLGDA